MVISGCLKFSWEELLRGQGRGQQNFQLPAGAAFAAWKGQYKSENTVDKACT